MNEPFLWEDPRRKPWERLPNEPDKQFRAFTLYRDLGYGRTLGQAYRRYSNKPEAPNAPTWFCRWAADWNWRERVESYDRYIDRAKVESQREAYAKQYHERGKTLADLELDAIELGHAAYELAMATREKAKETMLAKDWNNWVGQLVNLYATLSKVKGEISGPAPGDIPELTDEELDRLFGTPEEQERKRKYS